MQALFGPVDAILGKQKWILGDDKGGRARTSTNNTKMARVRYTSPSRRARMR
jgi:hypothetical protein